ncbi:MAG: phosphatase PAP2 family protein [Thermoanaerobaculia bacterium]
MRLLSRLWPEERIALAYFVAVAALLGALGISFTVLPLVVEYLKFVAAVTAVMSPFTIAGWWLRRRRGGFGGRELRADFATYARTIPALVLTLVAYTNVKTRILTLNPRLYDRFLERWDALLHFGGGDLAGFLERHTRDPRATTYLGLVYFLAWVPAAVPLGVALGVGGGAAARRAVAALSLAYLAGSFLYVALPSLGPAFAERARYAHLAGTGSFEMQTTMARSLRYLVEHPHAPAIPFFGIAAFPSLHLATSGLGLLLAWRWARAWLWLLVPWNLAIAVAAVWFGWHYILDFHAGLALIAGAWWAAGKLTAPG